jgi:crossover junction endodeoxyribonuclease RuvC
MISSKQAFRIIAIDPGYDRMGVAVLEKKDGKEILVHSECVETSKKLIEQKRLHILGIAFESLLKKYKPSEVALEKLFFANNRTTGIGVAHVNGIIKYLSEKYTLPLSEYTPTEVKVAVTSSGRAEKRDVAFMVSKLLVLPPKKRLDDELDAIAVGLTHLSHRKLYSRKSS